MAQLLPLFAHADDDSKVGFSQGRAIHKRGFSAALAKVKATLPKDTPLEIWFQDEARVGQKNTLTRRWARRGARPSAPKDQRTKSAYLFGAICPEHGKGAGLALPFCNTQTMSLHLNEISLAIQPGAYAVVLMNQAGWHMPEKLVVPDNISLIALPAKCPELNPIENIWQFLSDNWLSSRVFTSYDSIVDHCCEAWSKLVDQPWRLSSGGWPPSGGVPTRVILVTSLTFPIVFICHSFST